MHNTLTQAQVLNSAYKAWQQSGSKDLFAVFLEKSKADGTYWSA